MPKVKIYTTSTCPYCRAEKAWLTEQKIPYQEVLLDNDRTAQEEFIRVSGQYGTPFTVITKDDGSQVGVLGFDEPRLRATLGI